MTHSSAWMLAVNTALALAGAVPGLNVLARATDDCRSANAETDAGYFRQQQAAAAVIKLGGTVTYRDGRPDRPVEAIELGCFFGLTSPDIPSLSCFPHLRRLHVRGFLFNGAHLRQLAQLSELDLVELFWATISDEDLKHLQNMTKLRELHLRRCHAITGKGMEHLRKLVNIETLDLEMTKVDASGLAELKSLVKLKSLSLRNCDEINDQAVAQLQTFRRLEELDLDGTQITDKCLASLKRIPNLRIVSLSSTDVSREGLAALMEARPNIKIYTSPE